MTAIKPHDPNQISAAFSKTSQHDQKYQTILSVASKLFNIQGTRGTTLAQIADKLQLTKTSLYYYVKTKEQLVYLCYLNTCTEMQQMVDNAVAQEGSALDKLESLFRQNFDCWNGIINGHRGYLAGLTEIATLSVKHQKEILTYYRNFVVQVTQLIEVGQSDGSMQNVVAAKTASAVWGTLFWLPVWLFDVDKNDRENAFEQWLSVIKFGLNHAQPQFEFKNNTFDQAAAAPAGFDKKELNRKKQEAFFRVGTMFFNQKGFKGTSLDELAQSLGVTKGAFYYHIKSKDDLLSKCFERTINIEQAVLEQAAESDRSGIDKLAWSVQRLFDIQVGEQGPLIRYATMWSFSQEKRHEIQKATRQIRDQFGEIIKQGIADKSIRQTNLQVAENIIAGAIELIPDMNTAMDRQIVSKDAPDFYHIFFNGIAA